MKKPKAWPVKKRADFRLYVADRTPRSVLAQENLLAFGRSHLREAVLRAVR